MFYTEYLKSLPSKSYQFEKNFSFIDGFCDEKQQFNLKSSQTKISQSQTNSCSTSDLALEFQNTVQQQFFFESIAQKSSEIQNGQSIDSNGEINYTTPQQYEEKLEKILNQIELNKRNRTFLRLITIEKQFQKDSRLHQYFQWAIQQYREIKLMENYFSKQNSESKFFEGN